MSHRSISHQVLQNARAGELDAIHEVVRVVTPQNASVDTVNILFDHLTRTAVPTAEGSRSELINAAVAAARPTVCLRALWKIVDSGNRLKPDVKFALLQNTLDAGGAVFHWTSFCLQTGLLCLSEDMLTERPAPRLEQYFLHADLLFQFLQLGPDFFNALTSSAGFVELFVELWTAKTQPDDPAIVPYRIAYVGPLAICPVLRLASAILSKEASRDIFLGECNLNTRRCDEFCQATVDRISKPRDDWRNTPEWATYLLELVGITSSLVRASPLFRSRLTRMKYLTEVSSAFSKTIEASTQTKGVANVLCAGMMSILSLAMDKGSRSRLHRNWEHLHDGEYLQALFRITAALGTGDQQVREEAVMAVDAIWRSMSYPKLFSNSTFGNPRPSLQAFGSDPKLFDAWKRLLYLQDRAREACERLEARPSVFTCDYQHCYQSGGMGHQMAKQCAGCSSVVYCSQKCQERDWQDLHRIECSHAHKLHSERAQTKTLYDHETRGSHVALLEVIYGRIRDREPTKPRQISIIDLDEVEGSSEDGISIGFQSNIQEVWRRHPQEYLKARVDSLFEGYRAGKFPSDWRLVKGIFSPFTDDHKAIQLTVLVKPVEGGYVGAYCTARYL